MEYPGNLRPRSYFRRAFLDQHNLILLGGSAVLALAFGSFVPTLLGLCAEALFLLVCPRLEAFRAWIDGQDEMARKLRVQRSLRADVASLAAGYVPRLDTLWRLLDEVTARIVAQRVLSFEQLESVRDHFEQLLRAALEVMRTHQSVLYAVAEIPSLDLARDVARLEREFAAQRDLELRMGLRQQLLSAQKRLAQREELVKTSGKLELELLAIEKSVGYLSSRTAELLASGQILNEVRALVSEVAPASRSQGSARDALGGASAVSAPHGLAR